MLAHILNAIDSIPECEFSFVKFNSEYWTDYEDEEDQPLGKSLSIYVKGGDDITIAKTIYMNKPLGIGLNGDFCLYVDGAEIRWYNLNYENYSEQKLVQRRLNNTLEKESLLKRLAELEEKENV